MYEPTAEEVIEIARAIPGPFPYESLPPDMQLQVQLGIRGVLPCMQSMGFQIIPPTQDPSSRVPH